MIFYILMNLMHLILNRQILKIINQCRNQSSRNSAFAACLQLSSTLHICSNFNVHDTSTKRLDLFILAVVIKIKSRNADVVHSRARQILKKISLEKLIIRDYFLKDLSHGRPIMKLGPVLRSKERSYFKGLLSRVKVIMFGMT